MLRATALGAATALALTACGAASGGMAHRASQPAAPLGVVVLVPGSGFRGAGEHDDAKLSISTGTWRSWGFRTQVAPYRAGAAGLRDVGAAVRLALGTHRPVCIYGESSGGTWALDVAAREPAVRCVVTAGAPTDDDTWARSKSGAARYYARVVWPGYFGSGARDNLYEPYDVWRAVRPVVPVLGLYAANDPLVPPQQGRILAGAAPDATMRVLGSGLRQFVHSRVSEGGYRAALAAVRAFARGAASRAPAGG